MFNEELIRYKGGFRTRYLTLMIKRVRASNCPFKISLLTRPDYIVNWSSKQSCVTFKHHFWIKRRGVKWKSLSLSRLSRVYSTFEEFYTNDTKSDFLFSHKVIPFISNLIYLVLYLQKVMFSWLSFTLIYNVFLCILARPCFFLYL